MAEIYGLQEVGITSANSQGNALIYDLLAVGALDSVAQAVGRIDMEAARLVRMAQGIIRHRHNRLKEAIIYGPKDGQGRRMAVSGRHVIFESVRIATDKDTAELSQAQYDGEDGKMLDEMDGKIDGVLLFDIRAIMQIEQFLHHHGFADFYGPTITDEQAQMLADLQWCAQASTYYLRRAQDIIRQKLLREPRAYTCTACGFYYPRPEKATKEFPSYAYPDACISCGSPASWIVPD